MTDETITTDAAASQETNGTPSAPSSDAGSPAAQSDAGASAGTLAAGATATDAGNAQADTGKAADANSDAALGDLQKLRETLAGGDEKLLKHLERYKSKESLSKAFKEARQAAQSAGKPLRLGEKATEDEIKAYREAVGIPDDPTQYPINFRQAFKASDADKAALGDFKPAMHAKNVDPVAAQAALEWYQDFATAQQQELDGNLAKVAKETQAALRTEWGGEYDGNIGAVRELMTSHLGEDGFNRMMGMRLMDGSRLQDDPAFVKMMAQIGTDYYGSNAIYNGDIETTAKTVQERIDDLLALRGTDPEKYKSDKVQAEITKLYAQKAKINARK